MEASSTMSDKSIEEKDSLQKMFMLFWNSHKEGKISREELYRKLEGFGIRWSDDMIENVYHCVLNLYIQDWD